LPARPIERSPELFLGLCRGAGRALQQQQLALDAQQLRNAPAFFGFLGLLDRHFERRKALADPPDPAQLAFFVIPSVLLLADLPDGASIIFAQLRPFLFRVSPGGPKRRRGCGVTIPHSPASGATGFEIGLSAGDGAAAPDTRSRRFWKTT